jgi:hypothetical protein
MLRATKIRSFTPSAVWIRPHHRGRTLPLPPAGSTLAGLLTAPRAPRGQVWGRALAGLLVGIWALLTWQGVLDAWSPPDLRQTVTDGTTRPSLTLGSGASPFLNHPGQHPPVLGAGRGSPPFDRMAQEADDLAYDDPDDDVPSSLAILIAGAWLRPPAPAGRYTTGMKPMSRWPFRYLTRPQRLTRLSPLPAGRDLQ